MSKSVKPRIDFDQPLNIEHVDAYKSAHEFSESESKGFTPTQTHPDDNEIEGQAEAVIETALRPKRTLWRCLFIAGIVVFLVSIIAQGGHWAYHAFITDNWYAFGGGMAGGLIVLAGIGSITTEWYRLWRLRQRADERDEALRLLNSNSNGRQYCEKLAQQSGLDKGHPALQRWHSLLHDTHNDREVVMLYAQLVQPVLDMQVRHEITRSAAESALMIAVSPLTLVDMAFIAWRNIRLVNLIARLYGIELGYFSRIRLFRLVLVNIAFAGASELISELGMDWMSQDLAARLSTLAAQGIGAGLLTARLGIKAMTLCRPLPWIENDKPRLSDFRKQLFAQLNATLKVHKSNH